MTHLVLKATIAFALIAAGWVAAKAQIPAPDFEIIVDAPGGATTIKCVRGCKLAWVERGINQSATPFESLISRAPGRGAHRPRLVAG